MKKLFKKLRPWILKKLHATPNEVALFDTSKVVKLTNIPFAVITASQCVQTELLLDDDYAASVYRVLLSNIANQLEPYCIVETENDAYDSTLVRVKVYVGVKGK